MKQDEMDDLLKKEFSLDFNEQIPEHFLQDINFRLDQLENKKKRRLFLTWFLSFALISGALSLGYLNKLKNTEKYFHRSSKPKNQIQKMSLMRNNVSKHINAIRRNQRRNRW